MSVPLRIEPLVIDPPAAWIARRSAAGISAEMVANAWKRIADHLVRRDAGDLQRFGPGPRTVGDELFHLVQFPFGILMGMLLFALFISWLGWPLSFAPALAIAGGAVIGIRNPRAHWLLQGFSWETEPRSCFCSSRRL